MGLRLNQDSDYAGKDHWRWSIWLGGSDAELDDVDHVVYTLHPTFPDPVRTIADRASDFRLDTAGWGTFTIYARVVGNSISSTSSSWRIRTTGPRRFRRATRPA